MNQRILELANQCGYWSGQTIQMNAVGIEKFAELIVRECMAQCLKVEEDDESGVSVDALLCREEIRKHFGVE